MGTGSKKFRPAAGCNKMRMVRIPKWEHGQDLLHLVTRFKRFLEPMVLRDSNAIDPRLPRFPVCTHIPFKCHLLNLSQAGKQVIDLIVDFLSALWEYAKEQITREIGSVADLGAGSTLKVGRLSSMRL